MMKATNKSKDKCLDKEVSLIYVEAVNKKLYVNFQHWPEAI